MPINDLANLAEIREYCGFLLEKNDDSEEDFWPATTLNAFIAAEHRLLTTKINSAFEEFFTAIATSDITTGQDYSLPDDCRQIQWLEYHANPTAGGKWTEVYPQQVGEKDRFQTGKPIAPSDSTRSVQRITYFFHGNNIRLVPHFNAVVTGGLRIYYHQRLLPPVDDTWIPFLGLLKDHHELLAVGAVLRSKMREEITHERYADLYKMLWKQFVEDIEHRQDQRSRHVRKTEGLYEG